ncbi:putative acyl-activating enzyme 5, peroxisomal [Senna tora]|uniref:Putative acyl-activating enzyme 5, peroxisomal n=1 Tax=Senna tora TaxID=362788 RepID=A0A834SJU4_9FABA|nr:putative acyl-activating enzyme 5, peroxisomal [Senna tora]
MLQHHLAGDGEGTAEGKVGSEDNRDGEMDVADLESGISVKRDGSTLGEVVMQGGCVMLAGRGENVSSVEVESVQYSHTAVNEAAVVARPDEFWGETSCAFVSLKDGLEKKSTVKEIME